MRRIVILGGGVTGLALGFLRNRCPAPGDDVLILEEGPTPGGTVRTIREEGFVLEAGPVSLRTTPASDRLVEALGLSGDVLVADPRAPRWIMRDGRARRVAPGPSVLLGGALPLAARLRALIRRAGGHASTELVCGPLTLDTRSSRASVDGTALTLTSHEYRVLAYLMHHPGEIVSRAELTEHIYAQDFDRDSNTVEVFIARLRKKLPPGLIETVRGLGYRINKAQ